MGANYLCNSQVEVSASHYQKYLKEELVEKHSPEQGSLQINYSQTSTFFFFFLLPPSRKQWREADAKEVMISQP